MTSVTNIPIHELVQQIHDSPHRAVIATAGAGSSALMELLDVAGASRTLLEAVVPYCQNAFDDFLGQSTNQYVSEQSARLLAGRAYTRARQLANHNVDMEEHPLIGLSCSAAIVSDRNRRGEHRGYIATWQIHELHTYSVTLAKGARGRTEEESVYSHLMINALARACGLSAQLELPFHANEAVEEQVYDFADVAQQLHDGALNFFALNDHGRIRTKDVTPQTILSGSFNPLHDGHLGMARAASQLLGRPVAFELSAFNVDKPPIPPETVTGRIAQFAGRYPIYVSNAPTYIQKSRIYPGAVFIIGFDTAIRLFMPQYYNNSQDEMEAAIAELAANGCSFLVAGRVDADGTYCRLKDVEIPSHFAHLFQEIPEPLFRMDVSSTQLRDRRFPGSR